MSIDMRCGNTRDHRSHPHVVLTDVSCSGEARCGTPVHEAHVFQEPQSRWCAGICNCGLIRELHGPGAHK